MSKYKLFQWCSIQKKVVPIEKVMVRVHANAAHNFINDEMPPTKNPLNPKEIYTSKAKLRQAYKAAGAIEIGDAYDRGYVPPSETSRSEEQFMKGFRDNLRGRINNG